MYYFTIKNITKNDYYTHYIINNYYVLDIENNTLFVKSDEYFVINKAYINDILEYDLNSNKLTWTVCRDIISFNKCKNIIIDWDYIENGNHTLFLKNVIGNILIEIRNKKIDKILDVLF